MFWSVETKGRARGHGPGWNYFGLFRSALQSSVRTCIRSTLSEVSLPGFEGLDTCHYTSPKVHGYVGTYECEKLGKSSLPGVLAKSIGRKKVL